MAIGDLINPALPLPQYEFNGLMFGQHATTGIVVEQVTGLHDLPPIKDNDLARDDADGSVPYIHRMQPRVIAMKMYVDGDTVPAGQTVESVLDTIKNATQPQSYETPFVFMRPGYTEKRVAYGRCTARSFPSDNALAHGLAVGAFQWKCTDPKIYSLATYSATSSIPNGASSVYFTIPTVGGGTATDFTLDASGFAVGVGAIMYTQDPLPDGRTFFGAMAATGTLNNVADHYTFDTKARTLAYDGATANGSLDKQTSWMRMTPGSNTLYIYRTSTTGVMNFTVTWQRAWV